MLEATKKYISAAKEYMAQNPLDWTNLPIEKYRKMSQGYKKDTGPITENISIKEQQIPVADNTIKAKIFDIKGEEEQVKPGLIYIPGGGFIAYLPDCHDSACSIIANLAECRVILIEPRLAPEFPAPIPMQDTEDAIKYIFNNANKLNLDADNIALGGDSSGANLALCAALNFRDAYAQKNNQTKLPEIKHMFLISGTYDLSMSIMDPKYAAFEKEDILSPEFINYMFKHYLGEIGRNDPTVSPYFRDLKNLPDTTLIVAEYDGVRSQTEALALKLERAGVNCSKHVVKGQTHSFLILRGAMGEGEDPAQILANEFKQALTNNNTYEL